MGTIILVAGAVANKVGNGGGPWERLSWVTGLRRLGFDAWFVEQIAPAACVDAGGTATEFESSANVAWFRAVTTRFGLSNRSALVCADGSGRTVGLPWD